MSTIVVGLEVGLQLFIMPSPGGGYGASVILGEWPSGKHLSCTLFDGDAISVDMEEPQCLWLGNTAFYLPWHELNKVADFFKLPIPLPHPLGEQVPA